MRISDWSSDVCSSDLFYRQGCGRDREWRPDVALDAGSPGDRRRAVVAGRYDCGGARWSVVGHAQFYSGCRMRRTGFTLIELLVALVIFAMLAVAGVLLLGNSGEAQGQVRERLDELASLQRARGAPSVGLGHAATRTSRPQAGRCAPGRA